MTKETEVPKFDRNTATGTARNMLLEVDNPDLADMFKAMTPMQKAYGRLIGKLIESKNYDAIENAFTWFAVEHNDGIELDYRKKMLCIFQAAETLGCGQPEYNLIRKMYVTVNQRS